MRQNLTANEPMPAWATVDIGRLEGALAAPQRHAFEIDFYPELPDKTAILLYSMVKAHPWINGNKRMAFVSTFLFLGFNGFWWGAESEEARAHMNFVAASEARCSKEAIAYLCAYFRRKIIERPGGPIVV